jgi:hypothetical protein
VGLIFGKLGFARYELPGYQAGHFKPAHLWRVLCVWGLVSPVMLTDRYDANRRITGQFASSSDSRRENHDRTLKALPVAQNFDAKVM